MALEGMRMREEKEDRDFGSFVESVLNLVKFQYKLRLRQNAKRDRQPLTFSQLPAHVCLRLQVRVLLLIKMASC